MKLLITYEPESQRTKASLVKLEGLQTIRIMRPEIAFKLLDLITGWYRLNDHELSFLWTQEREDAILAL